jgi:trigger factor
MDPISQGVVGMKKDEKKEVEAEFDDDFELAPLAGKKVNYSIEVHEVREKKAPDADNEDFIKSFKVESLEELEEKVREDIKVRKERENLGLNRKGNLFVNSEICSLQVLK